MAASLLLATAALDAAGDDRAISELGIGEREHAPFL